MSCILYLTISTKQQRDQSSTQTHLIIVGRSSDMPQPSTLTPFGRPIGSNISGLNTPD